MADKTYQNDESTAGDRTRAVSDNGHLYLYDADNADDSYLISETPVELDDYQ